MRTLLLVLAAAGCAGGGASNVAPAPGILFASQLDVDFDSMSRRPSGLYVREYTVGDGAVITAGDRVAVRYSVYLTNGTRVDGTNADDPDYVFLFGRGQVIPGWDEGMLGMRVGGRRQLVIPPALGYGFRSRGQIPGNSTLVVSIHLTGMER